MAIRKSLKSKSKFCNTFVPHFSTKQIRQFALHDPTVTNYAPDTSDFFQLPNFSLYPNYTCYIVILPCSPQDGNVPGSCELATK